MTFMDTMNNEIINLISKRFDELRTKLLKKGVDSTIIDEVFGTKETTKETTKVVKHTLEDIFNSKPVKRTVKTSESVVSTDKEYTSAELTKMLKKDLEEICRSKNIKFVTKDTKPKLIEYIINSYNSETGTEMNRETKMETIKKDTKKDTKKVLKKIESSKPSFSVEINDFDHHELQGIKGNLIVSVDLKTVIGKQLEDGNIGDLEVEDIELCKKYKIDYKLPLNLNNSKGEETIIEELEELEGEEEVGEDIEEEEDIDEEGMIDIADIEEEEEEEVLELD